MRERLTLDLRDQQRIDILARWRAGVLGVAEAAALLECSERTAWRLRGRFTAAGPDGVVHGNRGRPAANRLPDDVRERPGYAPAADHPWRRHFLGERPPQLTRSPSR